MLDLVFNLLDVIGGSVMHQLSKISFGSKTRLSSLLGCEKPLTFVYRLVGRHKLMNVFLFIRSTRTCSFMEQ